jgi:hypothetical protein
VIHRTPTFRLVPVRSTDRLDLDREYPHPNARLYPADRPAPVRTVSPCGGAR